MTIKSYQIHNHPDRERFLTTSAEGIWREQSLLSSWVVTDPELLTVILRHPKPSMPNWEILLEKAEKAVGRRLENIRRASGYTPLLIVGEHHAALRKALAVYLAGRLAVLEPLLPGLVQEALAGLRQPGTLDLHADVVKPLVRKVSEVLVGCALPPGFDSMTLFQVFPAIRSPSVSIRVDNEFAEVFAYLDPHVSDEMDMACRICCLVFGVDTQSMLLVEGILRAMREAGEGTGAALPEFPVETGVPVSNRMSDEAWSANGHSFAPYEVVRLQLQALGYSADTKHNAAIYGLGPHSCVGKQVSLRVWKHVRAFFNEIAPKARLKNYKLHPSASICLYDQVEIEVLK